MKKVIYEKTTRGRGEGGRGRKGGGRVNQYCVIMYQRFPLSLCTNVFHQDKVVFCLYHRVKSHRISTQINLKAATTENEKQGRDL